MAKIPSPKETAINILDIFVNHFQERPSHVLRINNFLAVWHKKGLQWDDFVPGMEHAVEEGWVEVLSDGASFRLTQSGFDVCPDEIANIANQPAIVNQNFINIGKAINSPITQGIESTQTVTTNYSSISKDELIEFVNSFRENLTDLDLPSSDERKVNAQLATIEAQLIDEPNQEILKQAFTTLKNVTEGAIGSLLATAAQPGIWGAIQAVLSSF
jgi:hypothetical protein